MELPKHGLTRSLPRNLRNLVDRKPTDSAYPLIDPETGPDGALCHETDIHCLAGDLLAHSAAELPHFPADTSETRV